MNSRLGRTRRFSAHGRAAWALAALGWSLTAEAEPAHRYKSDEDEVVWMRSARPGAAAELDQGEALLRQATSAADVERAADLFGRSAKEAPESALAARRECQALTALGKHDAAVTACNRALLRGGKVLDLRAAVGALMSGPGAPTVNETGRALFYARRAIEILPNEPWGYAAQCDVAEKLGDTEMLESCTAALSRVAPGHYETERAEAVMAGVRPGRSLAAAFGLAALGAVATLGHRLRRGARRAAAARAAAGAAVVGLCVSLVSTSAHATEAAPGAARPAIAGHLSKYPVDLENPEASVPSPADRDKDPLEYGYFLMDVGDAADKAAARGDHLEAAKLYRALVKAVPDAAVGYRKTCEQYEAASDLTHAKAFCAAALTQKDAVLADYSHYARVVFAEAAGPSPEDVTNIDSVVRHLEKDPSSKTVAWDIECNLGVRLADTKRLHHCTAPWAAMVPDDPKVIFYQWVLALHEKDYAAAERLLRRARNTSAPPAQLKHMERATFEAMPLWRRGFRDWRVGAFASLVLFGVLSLLLLRSRRAAPAGSVGNGSV